MSTESRNPRSYGLDKMSAREIVRSVVNLGGQLNLAVIASGVETPQQLSILREFRCPKVQGFLIGNPCAVPNFQRALAPHGVVRRVA